MLHAATCAQQLLARRAYVTDLHGRAGPYLPAAFVPWFERSSHAADHRPPPGCAGPADKNMRLALVAGKEAGGGGREITKKMPAPGACSRQAPAGIVVHDGRCRLACSCFL